MAEAYDALVVGAGPNGLSAANRIVSPAAPSGWPHAHIRMN